MVKESGFTLVLCQDEKVEDFKYVPIKYLILKKRGNNEKS